MSFKPGDEVIVTKYGHPKYLQCFTVETVNDLLGFGVVLVVGDGNVYAPSALCLKEIWDSPLYKALNEKD